MRIIMSPPFFRIQEEKQYQLALTKTGKIVFYKVTIWTDLDKLEQKQRKNWQFWDGVSAYSKEEAKQEFLKEVKVWRKQEEEKEKMREEEKRKSKIYLEAWRRGGWQAQEKAKI